KENEYAKLWNDWYKKCDECKYDKISYDKAYKDIQQKIERLQAQLGDLKGKCKDTSYVSDTQNQVFQKLENANVELEFQVFNYAKENAHLKATYKNLFDSISVTLSDQKDNTQDTSKNTKFAKQPIAEILPKIGETNALSKPVTSNSVSTPQVSKGVNNAKVIAPGMFRISSDKVSREAKKVPSTVSASSRTKLITVSQPSVITKKGMNSNSNGLSSTGLDNTKTKISYDKAYKDMQQKIKRLQAQLRDLKGKNTDTACVSDTQNQLFQKLENANDSSKNTKFAKQPIAEILPKIGEANAMSKLVTSNSVSTPQVSKGVNNAKVIAPGMFRISLDKVSREAKKAPNTD
nr:hypothetical protein [Tanacetum cinerariifolium]